MANVITDGNIRDLVRDYINNRNNLPAWLQGIAIGDWDVSRVTNMTLLFRGFTTFNEPLTNWDVSNVRIMLNMFDGCTSFNQPLNNWNVSNVTNMSGMFILCTSFNQPLDNWDVSNVTTMNTTFARCTSFNQPLDNWNVSRVTNIAGMFDGCTSFNQPLNSWNVSNVESMSTMFINCTSFNQPLDNWNVSRVRNMISMFNGCVAFNQDLSRWNVSNLRSMVHMFRGCTSLTINPGWQINQETLTSGMFLETPLQGTVLQIGPQQLPQPQQLPPQPQLPRGVAYEIHNAFPELNFDNFMTIVRRDNNSASNFKDPTYPLQPLINYINTDTNTTIVDTVLQRTGERILEKTNTISDLNGEIKRRLNAYLSEHPESRDNVMEMIQFVMSQGVDYKDPYIRFLVSDCINAYGPRQLSCTKGVFERVFLTNKSVLLSLCSDDTSSSASSSASSCKPVYRELLGCFYPVVDLDALFHEWYEINNMEEGSTSPLANASEEERKENFRRFVLSKAERADPTAINKFISKYEDIFKTLITGGRRKRRTRKTKRKSLNKSKRKTLRKCKRKTKKRY